MKQKRCCKISLQKTRFEHFERRRRLFEMRSTQILSLDKLVIFEKEKLTNHFLWVTGGLCFPEVFQKRVRIQFRSLIPQVLDVLTSE